MRTFIAIADRWGLAAVERRRLLGSPSTFAYRCWEIKAQDNCRMMLSANALARISAAIGIHGCLTTIFQGRLEANSWLRGPHIIVPFNGQPPIELMIDAGLEGLLAVRRFLEAACQGIYMPPSSIDADFRPYRDEELRIADTAAPTHNPSAKRQ